MKFNFEETKIYVRPGATDLRKGAESSCWILTMIETAKIHSLSPEDYLRCVFERAPYCETTADWKKLLPWNIEITPFHPRGQWKK